jgi:hypothetical protein
MTKKKTTFTLRYTSAPEPSPFQPSARAQGSKHRRPKPTSHLRHMLGVCMRSHFGGAQGSCVIAPFRSRWSVLQHLLLGIDHANDHTTKMYRRTFITIVSPKRWQSHFPAGSRAEGVHKPIEPVLKQVYTVKGLRWLDEPINFFFTNFKNTSAKRLVK